MGDPKKHRKKYRTPSHPWQKEIIEEEKELLKAYGMKNKREIWKMKSLLNKLALQAKKLIASTETQAEIEKKQLMDKLVSLGVIDEKDHLEDVLSLTPKDVMERRLQTIVHKSNLSKSIKQARQFIIHRHIAIGSKIITSPSYLITKSEEAQITFIPSSSLASPDHPERSVAVTESPKVKETPKPKETPKATEAKVKETPKPKETPKATEAKVKETPKPKETPKKDPAKPKEKKVEKK